MKFFLLLMISLSVAPLAKQPKGFVKKSLYEGFIEKDFPFINSALDLGKSPAGFPKNNYTPRGVFIQLAEGTWACFDRDLLRVSAIWHGGDFEMNTMAQVSYPGTGSKSKSFPKIKGTLDFATGVYPGFSLNKTFKDPRKKPLGPLPLEQCSWKGIRLIGKETVLSYSIAGVDIQEQISLIKKSVYSRKLQFKANKPISFVLFQKKGLKLLSKSRKTLKLKDATGTLTVHADKADLEVNKAGQVLLTANNSFEVRFSRDSAALNASLKAPQALVRTHKPHVRWPQRLTTTAILSSAKDDYLVDEIKLPLQNPWRRSIRLAAIDFFKDGRAAALTFDGDVWLIDGLQGNLNNITWKRFASGIYAPLSLRVYKEEIYVFGRDQITRLHDSNKDDEADFYENYSTAFIQSMNTRDFSLDMVFANNGDIFISKGGIQHYGGKFANRDFSVSVQAGSVMRIFNKGRSCEVFADGFREPFLGYNPRSGKLLATDQQGHYVPATPILAINKGGYYGFQPANYRKKATEEPMLWIPHNIDNSASGMTYMNTSKMGVLNQKMVLHSYGKMSSFLVYEGNGFGAISPLQGISKFPLLKGAVNPLDGQLYVTGFKIYSSQSQDLSGLTRLRYSGKPTSTPSNIDVFKEGVLLSFDSKIIKSELENLNNYTIRRWNYLRSSKYGSGHYRIDGTLGEEHLKALKAIASKDCKSVFLAIPGMELVEQMAVEYQLKGKSDEKKNAVYFSVSKFKKLAEGQFAYEMTQKLNLEKAIEDKGQVLTASVALGKTLLNKHACIACHSLDGSKLGKIGPTFKGMYGSVRYFNKAKSQSADDKFIKESLIEPNKKVAKGFQVAMGSYAGKLTDVELDSIIMFLKTIGKKESKDE